MYYLDKKIFLLLVLLHKMFILCISGDFQIINGCGIEQLTEGPLAGLEKYAVTTVSGNEAKSVRCCTEEGDRCYTPQPCMKLLSSFHEAYEICLHQIDPDDLDARFRLCTEQEAMDHCCKTGCNIDREQYWLQKEDYDPSGKAHYAAYEYVNVTLILYEQITRKVFFIYFTA